MSAMDHYEHDRENDGGHHRNHHQARLLDWNQERSRESHSLNHPMENIGSLSNQDLNQILNHALHQSIFGEPHGQYPNSFPNNPFEQMTGFMHEGLRNLSDAAN